MKKFATLAALLVAASGALAQTDCESSCESKKDAAIQAVSNTSQDCQTACESATSVQAVSLTKDDCCGDCDEACKTECEGEGQTQAVQLVSFPADMPAMQYVVGDKVTRCSTEAGKLASACETLNVAYLVADKKYDCQVQAGEAYAEQLHGYLDRITRVSFVVGEEHTMCPVEAKAMASKCDTLNVRYKVGNTVFDCAEKAVMASAMAYGKAQHTQLTRAINGEATSCEASFKSAQACSETKATFLVNGRETECNIEADCMLTTARIEAAINAAAEIAGS